MGAFVSVFVVLLVLVPAQARGDATVRVGALKFGTVNWELDTIKGYGLDTVNGISLEVVPLASGQAGKVALLGGSVDVVVTDWIWVNLERSRGTALTMFPYSRAVGGLMVPADSPLTSLADLAGRRIAVAGGPLDKSWIILQAVARKRHDIDLAAVSEQVYGAPPLLYQQMREGAVDGGINFWHYLARLRAAGMREMISVTEAGGELGLSPDTPLLGYAFHDEWAAANPASVEGIRRASAAAKGVLRHSDEAWERLHERVRADSEEELAALRAGFIAGIPDDLREVDLAGAQAMWRLLARYGGSELVGEGSGLDAGTFYGQGDRAGS